MRYEEDNPYYLNRNSQKKYNSDFDYMNRNTGCASCENNSIDPDDNMMVPVSGYTNDARPIRPHMMHPMNQHMMHPMNQHMMHPQMWHNQMWHKNMMPPHMMHHPHMWHNNMWWNNMWWNNGFAPIVPLPAPINPLVGPYFAEGMPDDDDDDEAVFNPVGDMNLGMRLGMDDNMINSQNLSYSSAFISTPIVSRKTSELFD